MNKCIMGIWKGGYQGYERCSRKAVMVINGIHYCRQHGIKNLPRIKTVAGRSLLYRDNLRQDLINIIFEHDRR